MLPRDLLKLHKEVRFMYPRDSKSQEIGRRASRAFVSQSPMSWIVTSLEGQADFGIDGRVQVMSSGEARWLFDTQYKGSEQDCIIADGTFASVPVRLATLHYYRDHSLPVMLAFADFHADPDPGSCPVYYLWIKDVIDVYLTQDNSDNRSLDSEVTVRVPTANRLTRDTNVDKYLRDYAERQQKFAELGSALAIGSSIGDVPTAVSRLTENIVAKGHIFVDAALGDSDLPWPSPKSGTVGGALKEAYDLVTTGAVQDAAEKLDSIPDRNLADDNERALFYYISGRLSYMLGDKPKSSAFHLLAHQTLPDNPLYLCSWFESRIVQLSFPYATGAQILLDELDSGNFPSHPRIQALKARLMGISERYSEAHSILDSLEFKFSAVERAILFSSERLRDEVIELCASAQSRDLPRRARLTIRVIAFRARVMEALGIVDEVKIMALSGPPTAHLGSLVETWGLGKALVQDLRVAGWPENSEIAFDALGLVAFVTENTKTGLALLEQFLEARPQHCELQQLRLRLALMADDGDSAADAASRLPDAAARAVNSVIVFHENANFRAAVGLADQLLELPIETDMISDALVVCALSARKTFNGLVERKCLSRLKSTPDFQLHELSFELAKSAEGSDEELARVKRKLIALHSREPEVSRLQDYIFAYLSPREPEEASLLLKVSETIETRRLLFLREEIKLARALLAQDSAADALARVRYARRRFAADPKLRALEALVLERMGNAAEARVILKSLVTDRAAPRLARTTYLNIALRCGFLDDAIEQFEWLLTEAGTEAERLDALRGLFSLESRKGANSARLIEVASAYGDRNDQSSEEEEGVYLIMMVTSTMSLDQNDQRVDREQLHRRATVFLERFPNSRIFGAINIPNAFTAKDLAKSVRARFGISDIYEANIARLKNQLSRGDVALPYAWRPQSIFPSIANVSELWERTKSARQPAPEFSFPMTQPGRVTKDLSSLNKIPLLDITTLFVLTDLDLWPTVFSVFGQVAISKITLMSIQEQIGVFDEPSKTLRELCATIHRNIDSIVQPGGELDETQAVKDGGLENARELLSNGKEIFYSDDLAARIYVLGDAEDGICTADMLHTAQIRGLISPSEAAGKIAQIVKWHIQSVPISYENFASTIPTDLAESRDIKSAILRLESSASFRVLRDGAWDHAMVYEYTLRHTASFIGRAVNENPGVNPIILAAIEWSWLQKVRLRVDNKLSDQDQLSLVHIFACAIARESNWAPKVLWEGLFLAVEALHGERMETAFEYEACVSVGRNITTMGKAAKKLFGSTDPVELVRSGLTRDTARDSHFMKGVNGRN